MLGHVARLVDPEAVAVAAASRFAEIARASVAERGEFRLALAGGQTPLALYQLLAGAALANAVPWNRARVFWVDERCVPATSQASHYAQALGTLLKSVPVRQDRIHRVRTELAPETAAAEYTRELLGLLGDEPLDLVLLGMGTAGQVASIFPGSAGLYSQDRGMVSAWIEALNECRLTLTLAEINRARHVIVLVTGPAKATALADVMTGNSGVPAARLAPQGHLEWYVDQAAEGTSKEGFKRAAADAALEEVNDGMALGLGTGSTVRPFLDGLALRLASGRVRDVVGVATSSRTERLALDLGIPLTTLESTPRLDLAVDGADEIDPQLRLVKGGGGALVRERIVASAAERFVVIADDSKLVPRLGTTFALPVEVVDFGWSTHWARIADCGGEPTLRLGRDGRPARSDNGNYILDCVFPGGIPDPADMHARLRAGPGVVDTGLFLDLTAACYIAGPDGVRLINPS